MASIRASPEREDEEMFGATDTFKPGDKVLHSGIYDVTHGQDHRDRHEVTCLYGDRFPQCHKCDGRVRFRIRMKALYFEYDADFRSAESIASEPMQGDKDRER